MPLEQFGSLWECWSICVQYLCVSVYTFVMGGQNWGDDSQHNLEGLKIKLKGLDQLYILG